MLVYFFIGIILAALYIYIYRDELIDLDPTAAVLIIAAWPIAVPTLILLELT